ncbi:hypothetical protein B296_00040010 [Ensete ventricosum]|uniref:Uncharacterized protein n=1 Tax=Ensete ventricosum TaxID=4639 RepID=A0A426ZB27_ENSVE|nr:hypothetical protein B296_00040010 [Ensete ventricosum]
MTWGENMVPHATLTARGEGVWWQSVRTAPPRNRPRRCLPRLDLLPLIAEQDEAAPKRPETGSRAAGPVKLVLGSGKGAPGRSLVPAGRSGQVGSRRDPSDDQVSLVVDFAIPKLRRGARAFIATIGVSVPQSLIFFIAYHTATPHHAIRGPCGKARAYSRGMSTLLTLPVLGRSYDR